MAIISLNIPNAALTRLGAAIGYQTTINGVANPVTPQEAIRQFLANDIKAIIKAYESDIASKAAINTTSTDVDSITIT